MARETLDVDVLIVGGGPAGLSAALRLAQLQKATGAPLAIAVLEKAREIGAHMLSGAVIDPSTLEDLVPDFQAKGAPLATPVHEDRVYFLTSTGKITFPFTPPPLDNHGNYIISLSTFVKWLAGLTEAEGNTFGVGPLVHRRRSRHREHRAEDDPRLRRLSARTVSGAVSRAW